MKEAIVHKGPKVEIIDSEIPKPGPDQVVTKVVVSGSNPKIGQKMPEWRGTTVNQGDDIAGIVYAVGENVVEFKPGDRVAAFHEMGKPGGSYAEFAVSWAYTTFHIPKETTFEDAAAIPLAAMTAAVGLYLRLGLPAPWSPPSSPIPLIVYGAATAVGSYAIQLAQHGGIHPIIAVAGRGAKHVETLIDRSKGDTIVDYRGGDEALVKAMKDAAKGQKLEYAFDAVSEKGSPQNIAKVLDSHGTMTNVMPIDESGIPDTMKKGMTMVGSVHTEHKDFGFAWFRLFGRGLAEGWFKAHPVEVVPGGLEGVEGALKNLKDGKASAVKYVFRIGDTKGVKSEL